MSLTRWFCDLGIHGCHGCGIPRSYPVWTCWHQLTFMSSSVVCTQQIVKHSAVIPRCFMHSYVILCVDLTVQCTKTHNGTVTGNFGMKEVADEDGGLAHALDAISSLKTGGRLLRVGCSWSLSLLVAAIARNHYKIHDRFALSKPDCGLLLSQKGGFIYILSYPPAGFRLCSFRSLTSSTIGWLQDFHPNRDDDHES
jgi:hypothetical protein